MLHAIGALVILAGVVFLLFGAIAFLIAEFRESALWGLGGLFFPIVNIVFLILNWERAKNAFFLQLEGIGFLIAGLVLHGNFHVR